MHGSAISRICPVMRRSVPSTPFPAQPAFRAPDGPHAGAPRPHPPPATRRAQHRGAPRPQDLPVLRRPQPANPLCRGTRSVILSGTTRRAERCRPAWSTTSAACLPAATSVAILPAQPSGTVVPAKCNPRSHGKSAFATIEPDSRALVKPLAELARPRPGITPPPGQFPWPA